MGAAALLVGLEGRGSELRRRRSVSRAGRTPPGPRRGPLQAGGFRPAGCLPRGARPLFSATRSHSPASVPRITLRDFLAGPASSREREGRDSRENSSRPLEGRRGAPAGPLWGPQGRRQDIWWVRVADSGLQVYLGAVPGLKWLFQA